jgi:hypothetical protein
MGMVVLIVSVVVVMLVRMFMIVVIAMAFIVVMFRVVQIGMIGLSVQAFRVSFPSVLRPCGLGRLSAGVLDDLALDALAVAAAARIAMARAATVGAVFAFFLGFAMGALVRFDQRLAIGDGNLIIVRVNFAEGQEAVAVAAIFDEGGLQRRLYARDLGEVDVAAQLFALSGLEIKFFDAVAANHNDPGLLRVGSVYQHFVGHFGTLGGGGRV